MSARIHRIAATAILGLLATAPAVANADLMTGTEIRETISGKRIFLATPLGGEFPLFYANNGRVDGSGEAIGLGRWLKPTDSGRWWVDGNRLCQQWQTWYDGKSFCFTLREAGPNRVAWTRDDGYSGVARVGK
jgi:hypothetical protein